MPGSGGVEPKGAIPEKGKNVGLSIMGYRFAPGSTFLHSHPRRLQRVTANYVLATAGAHLSSACHCEPVRTLVRQSVSPQGNLASWLLFRQIRIRFSVIRFRYRFLPCPTARSTDCHVASLLAMTGGGVIAPHAPASPGRNVVHCSRTRVRTHLPSLSLRTSAHTGAAIRFPAGKLGKLAAV